MVCRGILLILSMFACALCSTIVNMTFPATFRFGAATSAYQIEGAWNISGKGVSSEDYFFHEHPEAVADGSNGDIACDSYHKYLEDIELLKALGVNHYRFSIAWSRILPTGFLNEINPDGVEYYNKLINGLLDAGIEPWVTMYHFDIPETINKLGGWNHPNVVQYFVGYADLLFSFYGDRVKTWLTINEPLTFCALFPVNLAATDPTIPTGVQDYLCSLHTLQVHAKVYRLYEQKYKSSQGGRIAYVANTFFGIPASDSEADKEAAERFTLFTLGIYLHPLVFGYYPQVVIDFVANYSSLQGFPQSRLPELTLIDRLEMKGAYDFFAINHYSCVLVTDSSDVVASKPTIFNDAGATLSRNSSWGNSTLSWLRVYPEGFRKELKWLKDTYNDPEIIITEQGFVDEGEINDTGRINYLKLYLNQLILSIYEDNVNVTGYTVWSLLDNFEWFDGYTAKFGLYYVDFSDPNRTRTAKSSAEFYKSVIKTRNLSEVCDSSTYC